MDPPSSFRAIASCLYFHWVQDPFLTKSPLPEDKFDLKIFEVGKILKLLA
jgi:hypothetical protein